MPKKEKSEGLIPIERFNFGGLSDSKFSGIKNSLYKLTGFDMHSTPGLLKVAQKLSADTGGSEPDEFCKVAINCTDDSQYWFSSVSGKIWERPPSGTWRLVFTITAEGGVAGDNAILGAYEYQGYIYIFTETKVSRISSSVSNENDWASDITQSWATFGIGDPEFHPSVESTGQVLYIGDGNQLAQIDAGVFSANALDISTPLIIKSLGKIGNDVLLGTTSPSENINQGKIIRWNTFSDSFTSSDDIPELSINAFLPADNQVYVQAGVAGNIYVYNGETLELYKKIPGDYSPTKQAEVYPNSVANIGGDILFGFSNITGNPIDQGIYRIGRNSKNYPYILDFPYPISKRSGSDFVLTGLNIGAILVVGSVIYVSWKDTVGSTVGVDKLDYSNKLDGAYFETMVMVIKREQFANFKEAVVPYFSLPDNTSINMYLDINHAGFGTVVLNSVNDIQRKIVQSVQEGREFNTLRLKVMMTTSGNNAPEVESCGVMIH